MVLKHVPPKKSTFIDLFYMVCCSLQSVLCISHLLHLLLDINMIYAPYNCIKSKPGKEQKDIWCSPFFFFSKPPTPRSDQDTQFGGKILLPLSLLLVNNL